MKQRSIFELRANKRVKTEYVDLTGDDGSLDSVERARVTRVRVTRLLSQVTLPEQDIYDPEPQVEEKVNRSVESDESASTVKSEGGTVKNEGGTVKNEGGAMKNEEQTLIHESDTLNHDVLFQDYSLKQESDTLKDGELKYETSLLRYGSSIPDHQISTLIQERVALQQDTISHEMQDNPFQDHLLLQLYSDADLDSEDVDYNFFPENDIDLNYQSDDEPEYCFNIIGKIPPPTKSRPAVAIDQISHLELILFQDLSCPICRVFLGDIAQTFREAHVNACIRDKKTVFPRTPLKTKVPLLPRAPLYKNRDASIPSPTKAIAPPKSLTSKSTRKPIPQLKTLSFPVNPVKTYSISMDAFNYAPDPEIQIYFLSHFHSDHYGGISKKWCYERIFECVDDFKDPSMYRPIIYCSVVTGRLLTLKFGIDPRFIQTLEYDVKYIVKDFKTEMVDRLEQVEEMAHEGLYVTMMTANHCPGSSIFLFESLGDEVSPMRVLHCGDFRVNKLMIQHPVLQPFLLPDSKLQLDKVYLDTTYLTFHNNFPKQEKVCEEAALLFYDLCHDNTTGLLSEWFGLSKQSRITDFVRSALIRKKKKFLIVVGTYIIGKEKLAIAILKKLDNCPIYISNIKSRDNQYEVVNTFGNDYLDEFITENHLGNDHCECVIHLVPMAIVFSMEELTNYFYHNKYFDHFEKCIGLRPTGWLHGQTHQVNKELELFEFTDISHANPLVRDQILNKICDMCLNEPQFTYLDNMLPQNKRSMASKNGEKDVLRIYSLPYSEHSSYRELSFFCMFLNMKEVIPTVNTESHTLALKMENHISLWKLMRKLLHKKANHSMVEPLVMSKIKQLSIDSF